MECNLLPFIDREHVIDVTDEHLFALPNRFFDYIKAGIPVFSSKAIEITSLIRKYNIGEIADDLDPLYLANKVLDIEKDEKSYTQWKENTVKAASDLCWENEEIKLISFMDQLK